MLLGRTDEVSERGSYLTLDTPGLGPIMAVRGKDGELRAFANLCRHRGAKLLREESGSLRGGIVCPYHAWTYDTQGALRAAPKMDDGVNGCFAKERYPLRQLRLEQMAGFVFVAADEAAPSLRETYGNVESLLLSRFPLEGMVSVGRAEYTVDCNWKFLMENTVETYHTSYVHKGSLGPMASEAVTAALGAAPVGDWDAVHVLSDRSIVPMPGESAPFAEVADATFFTNLFPSLQINLTRDCAWWMRLLPGKTVDQTRCTLGFLFPAATAKAADFEELVAPYRRRWDIAVREDNDISLNQQHGVASPAAVPGPYCSLEFATHRFDNFVLDRVLAKRAPPPAPPRAAGARPFAPAAARPLGAARARRGPPPVHALRGGAARQRAAVRGLHGARRMASGAAAPPRRFENQTAIVTGAGRDIGAATARRLAAEGARVCLHYHSSADGAEAVAAEVRAAGGEAATVQADLATAAGAAAVAAAGAQLGGGVVHVLVHNSGGLVQRRGLAEMDVAFLQAVMDLNFTSLFLMAQATAPLMTDGGAIVTLSSQAARDGGGPGAGAYAASKGAVHTYTRSLAKELAAQSVRVNTVSPGMIATGFHDKFTKPEVRTNVANAALLKREGDAAEVASTIAFLASADAAYLTGVAVDINGGLVFSG